MLEWVAFTIHQGSFPTQGSNPGLPHCRQILYQLSHSKCFIIIISIIMSCSQFNGASHIALVVNNPPTNAAEAGLSCGSGRTPRRRNGNALQYSCLENPMERGAWWATVHGVAKRGQDWATEHACVCTCTWVVRKRMVQPEIRKELDSENMTFIQESHAWVCGLEGKV